MVNPTSHTIASVDGLHGRTIGDIDLAYRLVLAVSAALHVNGDATTDTLATARTLANHLKVEPALFPGWDAVQLIASSPNATQDSLVSAGNPLAVRMDRVSALVQTVEALRVGRISIARAAVLIEELTRLSPPSIGVFCFAAGLAAASLALSFGETRILDLSTIGLIAIVGGVARKLLERFKTGLLGQVSVAGLIAGLGAAVIEHFGLSDRFALIAICPCMILLPGPQLLNGMLDLIDCRIPLGVARLAFAATVLIAISAGLIAGLMIGGQSLLSAPSPSPVPLWLDAGCGGVAAVCYAIFYATPRRMLVWPFVAGMTAHVVRSQAQTRLGLGIVEASAIASLIAGAILLPASRRHHLPAAGIGFASVVSMLPGVMLFPMGSAFFAMSHHGAASEQELALGALGEATTSVLVVMAIAIGLLLPKLILDLVLPKYRGGWHSNPSISGECSNG